LASTSRQLGIALDETCAETAAAKKAAEDTNVLECQGASDPPPESRQFTLADVATERRPADPRGGQRTVERWCGETLQMGVLYEGVAVDFWTGVVANARTAADGSEE